MKKKNTLPIKWMLGILILLVAVAYWTARQTQSKDQGILPAASNVSSQNNFFQFLANMLGPQYKSILSNQNEPLPTTPTAVLRQQDVGASRLPNELGLNVKAPQGTGPTAGQGTNSAQRGNNPGNSSEMNTENNSGNNSEINAKNNPENNSGSNSGNTSGNTSGNNSGNTSGNNSGSNSGNNSGGNSGGYSGCVLGCYPGCNPGCDPECKPSVCNLGNTSGNASGNNSGNTSGNNSGTNADQVPGNLTSGSINQYNLPTINPIPTDAEVSQSIAQQNQNKDSLAALVANHQALVVSVQQQAEASKYQTVTAQSIPAASTNQAPDDAVQKIKSKQVVYH